MINVLFCGNDKFFDGVLSCVLSILKRTEKQESFTFYIYTLDLSYLDERYMSLQNTQASFLDRVVKEYNSDNKVVLVDVSKIYKEELAGSKNEQSRYSPYSMLRVFADIVDGMPEKLLYLDCDLLFNRDVRLLYNIDLEDYEYAAARDHYGKYLVSPNYINSGVLLLNLKKIRETELFNKARETLRTKRLMFPDQSAIRINTQKKKMLPQKFNDQRFLHKYTVVRHFSKRFFWLPYPHVANIKQWQVEDMRKVFRYSQFDDILNEYTVRIKEFRRNNIC